MGLLELIVVFVLLVPLSLALLAILDVVRSEFRKDSDRILWALIVLLVPVIGPVLYYVVGRKQKLHS